MSESKELGPYDVVSLEAIEDLKNQGRKRVPVTATDAEGNKIVIGECDTWVDEHGIVQMEGRINNSEFTAFAPIPRSFDELAR